MIKKKFTSVNRSHGLRVNVGPQQRKRRTSPEVRAKHLQAQKDFKLRHPDRVRANNKAWYAKNTEYAKQTALQRYMADPGAAKIRHTKWLASKQEKLAKCVKHHIKKFTLIMIIKQANFVDGCVTVVTYQLGY